MDYQISIIENVGYVLIEVFQPMTSELGRRCGAQAAQIGEEKKILNFLFDVRKAPNIQSVVHNYDFAYKEMSDFSFPKASRSAFLVNPGDNSHDFIETAFLNAGYTVKSFTEEEPAISWLTAK